MVILECINEIGEKLQGFCGGQKKKSMKLTDYLDSALITTIEANDRDRAIEELSFLLHEKGKLKSHAPFLQAIKDRETLVSTGIGMGVAVPHAKLSGYDNFFIAVGIHRGNGLDWDALDNNPVKIVFMIGGPDNKQSEYLKILQLLTQAIKNRELRHKLCSEELSPISVIDLFKDVENGSNN